MSLSLSPVVLVGLRSPEAKQYRAMNQDAHKTTIRATVAKLRLLSLRPAKRQKHTTGGIPRWSPTLVLVARFSAYVWQSGRDAQFSLTYGRMCLIATLDSIYNISDVFNGPRQMVKQLTAVLVAHEASVRRRSSR
jgi:hypothetical protein